MDLGRTQFFSLFTKGVTTALGIIQGVLIIHLLLPEEYGLASLVLAIGGIIGVSQHLGIVDGAIREIAVRTDKRVIGKIFWVSHITRQMVTIPLSLTLILLAPLLANNVYHKPEIAIFIQLFAAVLVLQGIQDVLGATLTGIKAFRSLYIVQIITAVINIVVFGYLVWQYKVFGFFWAIIITTSIMVLLYGYLSARQLRGYLGLPNWSDIKEYSGRVMRIGAFMYLARIFFVVWQQLPLLILGGVIAKEQSGYLAASSTLGSRLTIIAMALSEVNLAWMSSLYATTPEEFRSVATRNMQRLLMLLLTITLVLLFFTPELIKYVIGIIYMPAQPLFIITTTAFFLYALLDIGTSSIFVSGDNAKLRTLAYGIMTSITAILIAFVLWGTHSTVLAAWAVLAGAATAYIFMVILAKRHFHVDLITKELAILLVLLTVSIGWLLTSPIFILRAVVWLGLTLYVVYEAHRNKFLPPQLTLTREPVRDPQLLHIICFAGAPFDQLAWTNRQQMMSRVAQKYPVLYIEPRMWIVKVIFKYWRQPKRLWSFIKKVVWYEKKHDQLFIKAQWNLIPGSRELRIISAFNHALNRYSVRIAAWWLHFSPAKLCLWIYDIEAVEFLPLWPNAKILYDCVDDHAAQAGIDRNANRAEAEEKQILKRADLVTVTSKCLLELKKPANANTHLLLNPGDVELFTAPISDEVSQATAKQLANIPHPRFGAVGALDAYKFDFDLLERAALLKPEWHFILIGTPVIQKSDVIMKRLQKLSNVHFLGALARQLVPAYVYQFDACIIPYVSSRYNKASFPLKFWEFMATGKPIIATGLPELEEYNGLIGYAQNADEFIQLSETWLSQPHKLAEQRQTLALQHTWQHRVDGILNLLQKTYEDRI